MNDMHHLASVEPNYIIIQYGKI